MEIDVNKVLKNIAEKLQLGSYLESITVRELVGWFDGFRRGVDINWRIRHSLEEAGLMTVPDFESAHIDGRVYFSLTTSASSSQPKSEHEVIKTDLEMPDNQEANLNQFVGGSGAEAAYRVSRLIDPRLKLISVSPNATIVEAITLMLRYDYSQLPVMTNERDIRGIISWGSIGPAMVLGESVPKFVRECMQPHVEVKSTDSLFKVINTIISSSYVLVRNEVRVISGILTTTDLSQQFQDLAEPFLLIGEIENHIRALIEGRFTKSELVAIRNENDQSRDIESVADLTLGEHLRLIENKGNWDKLGIKVDRSVFVKELDLVRLLRNDIVHFDSDRITDVERMSLRNFAQFMRQLKAQQRMI